jgi:hypothetical protein
MEIDLNGAVPIAIQHIDGSLGHTTESGAPQVLVKGSLK